MRDEQGRWPPLVAAVMAAMVPTLGMIALVRLPVPGSSAPPGQADAASIEVVFLHRAAVPDLRTRPVASAARRPSQARTSASTPLHMEVHASEAARDSTARHAPLELSVAVARSRLDLSVRDPVPAGRIEREATVWIERERVLNPRTTRFGRAWVPAGNAIEQARFRSAAVNAALGLFGGPPRRCTEVEHRLRVHDCLPLDADEADTEALRRAID
jgi:hypothetical protein